jgi:hypothetical protein
MVGLAVDLGEHSVHSQVAELFLAAHVPVQGTGDHAQAGGEGAHAQHARAIGADDRERLGDQALAGQRAAPVLRASGGIEPQQILACADSCVWCVRHGRLRELRLT